MGFPIILEVVLSGRSHRFEDVALDLHEAGRKALHFDQVAFNLDLGKMPDRHCLFVGLAPIGINPTNQVLVDIAERYERFWLP